MHGGSIVSSFVVAVAAVATATACWSSRPAQAPAPGRTAPADPVVAAGRGANPATCPATFVQASGACTGGAQCGYAEGQCYCGETPVCSGVDRGDEPPGPTFWQCTPTPPAIRADGCPGAVPSGACATPGKVCGYGDCCVSTYTCAAAGWTVSQVMCPP